MNMFQPRSGSKIYTSDNHPITLDQKIGEGGEGSIWSILEQPKAVAKFYHRGLARNQAQKLEAMCRLKSENLLRVAAWPTAMLKTTLSSEHQGLLMPRVNGCQPVHLLYSPKSGIVAKSGSRKADQDLIA
jgi:DNA-binding helix-hairpin-helix protein with protein kinase domain